jgi:light-regulated signal transduction histidine kinase (bacteriophytochrome)
MEQLLEALRKYLLANESALVDFQMVDLNAIVERSMENLRALITETGAVVECGSMPSIMTIEVLVSQVIQNLVANAIKYRSHRPPLIRISATRAEKSWIFAVADNGIGIDKEHHDYVFGAFKRLRHGSGAGMGLAICKASVERLGGRIWLESELGAGSTFLFALPDPNGPS